MSAAKRRAAHRMKFMNPPDDTSCPALVVPRRLTGWETANNRVKPGPHAAYTGSLCGWGRLPEINETGANYKSAPQFSEQVFLPDLGNRPESWLSRGATGFASIVGNDPSAFALQPEAVNFWRIL
jgi:hypothetical protein